jgi:SAM-dependent methyltransferase
MPRTSPKQLAKALCPPILWRGLQSTKSYLRRSQEQKRKRVVTTLTDLDWEIGQAEQAAAKSFDAFWDRLHEFHFDPRKCLPSDPYSPEYAQAQLEIYYLISGKTSYSPAAQEMTPFDFAAALQAPYPYCTKSVKTIGDQLIAIGFLIRAMQLSAGGTLLEFGPGWGKATLEFSQAGYAVTAVDINSQFLELIAATARRNERQITTVCSEMLQFQPTHRFDRVVFYESFHHCHDHVAMIRRLDELVAPDGAVIFAGEPIDEFFPQPWGIRLDGLSVWAIRRFGWFELGFRTDYFESLLQASGWRVKCHRSVDAGWQRVYLAGRK